jgi:hypothetical protein
MIINPADRVIDESERYLRLRRCLIALADTIGPHRITMTLLSEFNDQWFPPLHAHLDMIHKIDPIFRRLVAEFCPIQLIIPDGFEAEQRIAMVDDNTDYIYAIGVHFGNIKQRVLCLSNVATAVLLRIAC